AYTSQRCYSCGYTHKDNRDGRKFLCKKCGYTYHADCNAGSNIEDGGLKKLGSEAMHGQLNLRNLPDNTGSTHVKGRLDVEGSCVSSPEKRQAQIGERDALCTVVLWRDV
ncbi:MAG: transposase, partial [Cenarchaeum sp. SB0663_bin_5]|nr:transposase [Cenarchaeum sp. SB0663_bin_5]